MAWIQIHQQLKDHRKVLAAADELDIEPAHMLGLLISFNVVNMHNDFVSAIWRAVNALLDPILAPIKRIMPNTGAIDFSPLVLIVGLEIIRIVLKNVAYATL